MEEPAVGPAPPPAADAAYDQPTAVLELHRDSEVQCEAQGQISPGREVPARCRADGAGQRRARRAGEAGWHRNCKRTCVARGGDGGAGGAGRRCKHGTRPPEMRFLQQIPPHGTRPPEMHLPRLVVLVIAAMLVATCLRSTRGQGYAEQLQQLRSRRSGDECVPDEASGWHFFAAKLEELGEATPPHGTRPPEMCLLSLELVAARAGCSAEGAAASVYPTMRADGTSSLRSRRSGGECVPDDASGGHFFDAKLEELGAVSRLQQIRRVFLHSLSSSWLRRCCFINVTAR